MTGCLVVNRAGEFAELAQVSDRVTEIVSEGTAAQLHGEVSEDAGIGCALSVRGDHRLQLTSHVVLRLVIEEGGQRRGDGSTGARSEEREFGLGSARGRWWAKGVVEGCSRRQTHPWCTENP